MTFPVSQREFQKARAEPDVNVRDIKVGFALADDRSRSWLKESDLLLGFAVLFAYLFLVACMKADHSRPLLSSILSPPSFPYLISTNHGGTEACRRVVSIRSVTRATATSHRHKRARLRFGPTMVTWLTICQANVHPRER